MELDRQAIERRDFPIGRRGYDTAAVDAHLRALAAEVEELQRASVTGGAEVSLASTAGSQVQSILAAAETAAAEIERHALDAARQVREAADSDAASTREQAIEKARAHVDGVAGVAAKLLERVASMDSEASALTDSLRAGATRLAADLSALEENMGELYDAAAQASSGAPATAPAPPAPAAPAIAAASDAAAAAAPSSAQPAAGGDVDGARLIALNMALNGEPRTETDRYLAENFQLSDRGRLIDEVYAAIEG